MARAPIPQSRRLQLLERYGVTQSGHQTVPCWWCGTGAGIIVHGNPPQRVQCWGAEIDHLIPVARGGINALDNLVFSCQSCNASRGRKHDTPPRLRTVTP